jgi:hypothetical protein
VCLVFPFFAGSSTFFSLFHSHLARELQQTLYKTRCLDVLKLRPGQQHIQASGPNANDIRKDQDLGHSCNKGSLGGLSSLAARRAKPQERTSSCLPVSLSGVVCALPHRASKCSSLPSCGVRSQGIVVPLVLSSIWLTLLL